MVTRKSKMLGLSFFSKVKHHPITAGAILLCLSLAGCNGTIHRVPETVKVPVPVTCLKKSEVPVPKETFLSDTELFVLDRYQRTLRMWEERLEYQSYTAKLTAVLIACTGG